MKKRHQQKLVVLSLVLFILLNAPILLLFNQVKEIFGLPLLLVYFFSIWLLSSLASFLLFKKFDE